MKLIAWFIPKRSQWCNSQYKAGDLKTCWISGVLANVWRAVHMEFWYPSAGEVKCPGSRNTEALSLPICWFLVSSWCPLSRLACQSLLKSRTKRSRNFFDTGPKNWERSLLPQRWWSDLLCTSLCMTDTSRCLIFSQPCSIVILVPASALPAAATIHAGNP